MEWLTDIFGGVASAASGGLFGLLGSGIGAVAKYFQKKQEHKQKCELARLAMDAEAQRGSWQGLISSHESEGAVAANTYKWVNAIKSLYRPVLTTLLVVVTYLIFTDILKGLSGLDSTLTNIFTGPELKEIIKYIVYSIVFATGTAIVWWYGDRCFAPPGLKNR